MTILELRRSGIDRAILADREREGALEGLAGVWAEGNGACDIQAALVTGTELSGGGECGAGGPLVRDGGRFERKRHSDSVQQIRFGGGIPP